MRREIVLPGITCAVLMCHAPIVLPEVAGRRAAACETTTRAMKAAARRLIGTRPETLVIVSPHTPRRSGSWGIAVGDRLWGDFRDFGAPQVSIDLPISPAVGDVEAAAAARGLATHPVRSQRLDHGAMVPLHFVIEAGWAGPTILLALPWEGGDPAMGEAIAEAMSGKRWAFLASGDMSHRLIPGAPSGFHPQAAAFDRAFVDRIRAGDLRGACAIDPNLRDLAAEDVVDSVAVASGAVGFDSTGFELLAYEGPFGVGYCEAVLHEEAH
jgi:aromatic ring-opening dioxygenase LigB subunit